MSESKSAIWLVSFDVQKAQLPIYELALEPLEGAVVLTNPDSEGFVSVKIYLDGEPSRDQVEDYIVLYG